MDSSPSAAPATRRARDRLWIGLAVGGALLLLAGPVVVGRALHQQGYMPHGHCYLWQPSLVGLHVASDTLIGLAYLAISSTLVYLVYRARRDIPFHWMFLAFGTFILACGATHFVAVWTLWNPDYWFSGSVKLVTALASVTTAVVLPPLVPRVLRLARAEELAERRRVQLEAAEERAALLASEQAARAEAEQARADAEAASRAKDQFLATVSHELRNPLSPILTWARLLRTGSLDAERTRRAIDVIERSATSQAQLVDDLLDVSRIVSGKLRMDVRPVELAPVVEAAAEAARVSAEAKQIHLQLTLDPRAGPVAGDPEWLQQVVWNLLSNAIKYTPRGGRVQVRVARVDSQAVLTVSDSGAGIAPELLPHLFERFWQAESGTTRRHGGLGLGLAIVRHVVELHGGTVSAASDGPGTGAVFRVSLPVMVERARALSEPPAEPRQASPEVPSAAPSLAGVRVVVVDDEPSSNEAVQIVLDRAQAEVRVAGTAEQALEIVGAWRPDVLISDIGMPEQDGYWLIERVRQLLPGRGGDVPAIALTAYARTEDRVRTFTAGFQMHLAKPVDPDELVAAVAALARKPADRHNP